MWEGKGPWAVGSPRAYVFLPLIGAPTWRTGPIRLPTYFFLRPLRHSNAMPISASPETVAGSGTDAIAPAISAGVMPVPE